MTGGPTCAWPNKYSNSGSPCPLQQRQPARTACSARDGVQQRWFKGRHGHDCNCATQRAVRGPRPASPCTHLRGAPAATLGNHHVANGVENRRWGDRRRTGVPRVKREAAEDAAKYATQNTGHGTLWGWLAGAAGPQGPRTTPLLPKPHTCACDASSRKRSGAGNARGLPRCRAPVNVDGGPHQR